jgi:DNA-directed RNA polymerase specialized sigma subunit
MEDVYAIRADPRLHREIAADYEISRSRVSYIKRRQAWAHLPEKGVTT